MSDLEQRGASPYRRAMQKVGVLEAEIERLKAQHEEMLLKGAREQHVALKSLDEACKEIERLKDKICGLEKLNQMTDEEVIIQLKAEIERLKTEMDGLTDERDHWKSAYSECFGAWKALMSRAADALSGWSQNDPSAVALIAELRKAAE